MKIPSSINCIYLIIGRPFRTLISGPACSKPCFSPTTPALPVLGAVGHGYSVAWTKVLCVDERMLSRSGPAAGGWSYCATLTNNLPQKDRQPQASLQQRPNEMHPLVNLPSARSDRPCISSSTIWWERFWKRRMEVGWVTCPSLPRSLPIVALQGPYASISQSWVHKEGLLF